MTDQALRQLVIVEEGEYSDFGYTALSVPAPFDPVAAVREFSAWVQAKYGEEARRGFKINESLAGWLVAFKGAEDATGHHVIEDPVHYGCLGRSTTAAVNGQRVELFV